VKEDCHCGLDPLPSGEEFSLSAEAVDGDGQFVSLWQIYINVIAGLTRNPWWRTQNAAPATWMPDQVRHDKSHQISRQQRT
jgi:hypothetical protein